MVRAQPTAQNMRPPAQQEDMFFISRCTCLPSSIVCQQISQVLSCFSIGIAHSPWKILYIFIFKLSSLSRIFLGPSFFREHIPDSIRATPVWQVEDQIIRNIRVLYIDHSNSNVFFKIDIYFIHSLSHIRDDYCFKSHVILTENKLRFYTCSQTYKTLLYQNIFNQERRIQKMFQLLFTDVSIELS